MRRTNLLLACVLPLAACGSGDAPAQEPRRAAAAAGGAVNEVCRVEQALTPLPDDIHESSGVAASRAHPGVFWTHNDSGDPVLFAVDASGRLAGQVRVRGAEVEDWEDVAVGPCPGGGDCLYLADIGDNQAERPAVTVWRVPEPAPGDAETRPAEAIRLRYPDGAQDAEALFVLPDGRIHLLTKGETGPVALYRVPAGTAAGATATLERVRELAGDDVGRARRVTGASASADGEWVAVRTLRTLAFYPAGALLGGGAVGPRQMDLGSLDEAQGEGVGFAADGAVLLTSEGGKKKDPATFARLACTL
ncbi:MAG TPA: hypothetical protein VFX98_18795 [Longimicrobiaceae bacterium]|nr:hypothetical protein [Longimicrobiaceae bacterium]